MKERLTTYVIALPATSHTHTNTPSLLQGCESKKKKKKKKKKRKKNDNTKRVKLNYNNDNNLPASNSSTKNKKIKVLDATDNPFSQFVYKGCLSNSYFKTTEKEGPDDALKVKKTTTQTVKLSHYFSNHPDKQNSVAEEEEEEEEAALVVCKKHKLSAQQKACFPNPVSDQGISKKGNSTAVEEEEEEAVVVCKKTKKRKRSGRQKVCFSNPVSDQGISKKGDSVVDEAVASTSGSHATEKVKAKEEVVVCKKKKKDKHSARQKVCISNPVTDSGDQEISQAENSAGVKVSHYFSTEKHVACKKNDSHSTVKFVSPYFQRKANEEEVEDEVVVVCKKKKKDNLTARQKRDDAYKKKTPDNTWKPPRSHHNLIQEDHIHDPWRIVVICILLNMTQGVQVRGVISEFFSLCPDAKTATEVPAEAIEKLITPLGLQKVKTERIQRFSEGYLWDDWTHITQLHGVGKYAADAYAIFVTGQWRRVIPADHMLNRYWEFLHQNAHYWTN